jgi:hypothetical protein
MREDDIMSTPDEPNGSLVGSEDGGRHRWPPKLSAHRLCTVGIVFICVGVLAGEWIMPAVAAAVDSASGSTTQIGTNLVFGLTSLLTKLLLPLGIGLFSASLVVRALDADPR